MYWVIECKEKLKLPVDAESSDFNALEIKYRYVSQQNLLFTVWDQP